MADDAPLAWIDPMGGDDHARLGEPRPPQPGGAGTDNLGVLVLYPDLRATASLLAPVGVPGACTRTPRPDPIPRHRLRRPGHRARDDLRHPVTPAASEAARARAPR